MDEKLISRINQLAKKNKATGLSQEEKEERARLREQYLKEFRRGMEKNIMNNLYVVDEMGNKKKVEKIKNK